MVFETDDCLLSVESLNEQSLCDTDMQSLLVAWARKCRQGTFSARVSLLKNNYLSAKPLLSFPSLSPVIFKLSSPVFRVNDGVDKRVVDGRCFGYNSRDSFGIGIEDASISERCKAFVKNRTVHHLCCGTGT